MAKCCAPTQGDKIIAYSGMGDMTIHQHDCINIPKIDLDRRIPAHWSHIPPDGETICIEIVLRDRRGILRQLTDIFYQMGLSIEDMHAQKKDGIHVCDTFTLYTPDEDYYVYERIVERIQTVIPEYVSARKIPI
jgi:(p)ppGpp synthase/HD superfamily hydrolase